jgi:hypothetical protein
MVEPQPSKLMMAVRSRSPAPDLDYCLDIDGERKLLDTHIAQWVSRERTSALRNPCSAGNSAKPSIVWRLQQCCSFSEHSQRGERPTKDVWAGYIEAHYVSPWMACRGLIDAHIAQSVEHFLGKEEVTGSIPVMGSMHDVVTR